MTEIEKMTKAHEMMKDAMGLLRSIEHNIEATKAADNLDITAKGLFKFLQAEDRKIEMEMASQPEPEMAENGEKTDAPLETSDDADQEAAGKQSVEHLEEAHEGGCSRADELKLNPFANPAN